MNQPFIEKLAQFEAGLITALELSHFVDSLVGNALASVTTIVSQGDLDDAEEHGYNIGYQHGFADGQEDIEYVFRDVQNSFYREGKL